MPFVPINQITDPSFPRVSPEEQAARDAVAERIVADEFQQDMPDENRAGLEREYRQRFGKEPPAVQRGFVPLADAAEPARGFTPEKQPDERHWYDPALRTVKAIGQVYPVAETAANIITQGAAIPIAGLAGLGTAATNAIGLTDTQPSDVVGKVAGALTYQPKTDLGQHLTRSTLYPFELLNQGAQAAGEKTLDTTNSPATAAAVDTAINVSPMLLGIRGGRAWLDKFKETAARVADEHANWVRENAAPIDTGAPQRGFVPLEEGGGIGSSERVSGGVPGVGLDEGAMLESGAQRLPALRRPGDQGLPGVATELPAVPGGPGAETITGTRPWAPEYQPRLLPGQLSLDDAAAANRQPSDVQTLPGQRGAPDGPGGGEGVGISKESDGQPIESRALIARGDEPRSVAEEKLATAGAERRDAAIGGLGEADRPIAGADLAPPEGGMAGRTGFVPLNEAIDTAAHEAATSPLNDKPLPSDAQIEQGNYSKGHLNLHGLDITIENPRGSIRSGTDATGRPWQTNMADHYGYVKRSTGADGEHVDVFIGKRPESEKVFVVDQIDPRTGKYDEHKAVMGATSMEDAKATYLANYEPGWKGMGPITEMDAPRFKEWLNEGDTTKPLAIEKIAGRAVTEFTDSQLDKITRAPLSIYGEPAKVKALREIERRTEPPPLAAQVQNSMAAGANHVGMIDDSAAPATAIDTGRAKPITREEVLSPLMKALDTTIYTGRIKGEKKLGHYRPKFEEVRIKRAADIETAAHEIAHLLDDRIPAISNAWRTDNALRDELRSISYDRKKTNEGFAEGVRLWMTQPDVLQARAPKVHAWLDSIAANLEYGPALKRAQQGMTSWFGQDAINRARSKIGKPLDLNEAFDGMWDKFRQSTVDDLHGVYRMERELKGGIAPAGPYESARLSRASQSIADGALRFGAPAVKADGSFTFKGKGLEEILKPVADGLDDSLLYFVGKSAKELQTQGREHLFTPGEVDAMLRLRTPARDAAFAEYQKWNKGILDFAESRGVINHEARRMWQRTQYMPFHRAGSTEGFKGKPGDWSGIKALTGGTENLRDILDNMTANAAQLIDKAVKNEARQKIAALANERGGGRFMVKIDAETRPVKVDKQAVLDGLLKTLGIDRGGMAPPRVKKMIKALQDELDANPGMLELYIGNQPPAGRNVVAVLNGGKPTWYEVADPILYRALSAIDRPVPPWIVKWLGWPKRIGQTTITLTPDFMVANIARDTIMGSVMSRAGFRPIMDSMIGMRLRITKDPLYRDYIANGGGLSSIFMEHGKFKAKLERFYSRQGIDYRTVLDAPEKLLGFLESLGDAFEMSTRMGEYKQAIEKGENPRHAAYLGRDVSTDFAMRGDSKALGFMYDTIMFLRPAVISIDRLYRGLAHDPNRGAIATKAGMLAMMSAALYLLNRDDKRYQDLNDWDRDANWHFFVGDQHFRYPKIWEIGAIASAAERTLEKIIAQDPAGLGKDFARIIQQTMGLNYIPQAIAPLAEQAMNRNAFTNSSIETPGMEDLQPFLRAKPWTSETLKAAGMASRNMPEYMQVNPVRAEALLRGYFNTWAMYGLALTDKAFFDQQSPDKRLDEMPVVHRFYSQEPPQHTKYETMFYNMLEEAKRLRGTLKELDKVGHSDIADEKEKSPLAGEAQPLERAGKNLHAINQEMRLVRRSDATPAEKRQKLDELTTERNALLKATVQDAQRKQTETKDALMRAESKLQKFNAK
jgi:hypothetical protein